MNDSTSALSVLESTNKFGSRVDALNAALRTCTPAELKESPAFRSAISALGSDAMSASAAERLQAIALVPKLRKVDKGIKKLAEVQLKFLLREELGPLFAIDSDKEQLLVCGFITKQRNAWTLPYLSKQAFSPIASEKLRHFMISEIFRLSPTWAEALGLLVSELPSTQSPGALTLRGTIFRAGRLAIAKAAPEPGVGLLALVSQVLAMRPADIGNPANKASLQKLAQEAALFFELAVTRRPALLNEKELIELTGAIKGVARSSRSSPAVARSFNSVALILGDLILTAARIGCAPVDLFSALETLLGSREAALRITRGMVKTMPSPTAAVAALLQEGYVPEARPVEITDSADSALATALLRAEELLAASDKFSGEGQRMFSNIARALAVEVRALAQKRGIELVGSRGDVVQFDPLKHRVAGAVSVLGSVRIAVPAVVRSTDGRQEIIFPAVVEAST